MTDTQIQKLEAALSGVHLSDFLHEAPPDHYRLDLLMTNAIIEPQALLAGEMDLLHLIHGWPDLAAYLSIDVPEETDQLSYDEQLAALDLALRATGWLKLEAIVGTRELALRLIAALVTLSRGKMYTMRDFGQPYDVATEAAKRGYLSLLGVNIDFPPPREGVGA